MVPSSLRESGHCDRGAASVVSSIALHIANVQRLLARNFDLRLVSRVMAGMGCSVCMAGILEPDVRGDLWRVCIRAVSRDGVECVGFFRWCTIQWPDNPQSVEK